MAGSEDDSDRRAGIPDRRQAILDAAKAVFADHGLQQATVRQISARAGVLPGSLHYFFPSKLDLVDAILSEFCTEVLAGYRAILREGRDNLTQLLSMARYAVSLLGPHRAAMVIILRESDDLIADERFSYLVKFNAEVEKHWLTALRGAARDGTIRTGLDAGLFYRFCRDAILAATGWFRAPTGDTTALADELVATMVHGLTVRA